MRTLNLRLTAWILVGGLVVGTGVHLLHGYQVRRNADSLLEEAGRAKEAGKTGDAVRGYRAYLEYFPDDVGALADLGMLLADAAVTQPGARRPAYETLERALRLAPDRTDLRRRLVPLALDLGRPTDAHEHLVKHLLPDSPEDPELQLLLARAQEGMGKYVLAEASYRKAIGLAPAGREAYIRLANMLRKRRNAPKEADAVMTKMVAANEGSCEAHVVYGRYLLSTMRGQEPARLDQAVGEAATALKLAPEDLDALYLAAQCAVKKEQYDQALAYAKQAVAQSPRFAAIYSVLADIEVKRNHRAEAIDWLRQGIQKADGEADLTWALGNLLVDDGKVDEARQMADRLRKTNYPEPLVVYLHARSQFAEEKWLAASQAFERIRADLTAWPDVLKQLDFWLGGCYRRLGNADQQLTAYRRAVSVDPFWIPARAGVAAALLSMGRIEEAQDEYRELIRLSGRASAAAVLDLAQLEILRNLRSNRGQRHWDEAERLIGVAEKAAADEPRIPILRAEILVAQERVADAQKLLQDARKRHPHEITYYRALASLAQRERDWAGVDQQLDEARKEFGDRAALRLARAQQLVAQFGKESAERVRKLAEGADRLPEKERVDLWRGLAVASMQVGDFDQTRRLCQRLSEQEPHNLQVRLVLFDLALRAEDASGLGKVLQEIHAIEGDGPYWHYGTALDLSLRAKKDKQLLDSAQEHLAQCRTLRPGWSRVPFLSAEICLRQGNEELAIDNYLRAVDLGERSPRTIRRVVQLLAQRKRFLEADRIIRRIEEQQSPFSADLSRMASEVSLRLDDFDRALDMAKQAAAESSRYQDHIWLGQVLGILGQRARAEKRTAEADRTWGEAEKELRRAVELSHNATDAWVSMIQFLVRTDQQEKAEKAVAEAEKKLPADEAALALAQCYEIMGNRWKEPKDNKDKNKTYRARAEEKYKDAVAASPADVAPLRRLVEFYLRTGKTADAQTHLKRIVAGEVKAGGGDLVWARRALALILAGQGTYDSLRQGLELVEENLRTAPAVQDLRAKAILLSGHPQREEREKAVDIFEKVLQDPRVATAGDRLILARLYLAQGPSKWALASRQFRSLLTSAPDQPQYAMAYAAALLAHKEVDEAERWLDRLEKVAPGQFSTVTLRAQALCQRGKYDQAIGLLQGYLQRPESQGTDRAERIGLIATRMEDMGNRLRDPDEKAAAARFAEEAEKLYRQYAKLRPENELLVAGFLARQKRLDEATAAAEKAWPAAKPAVIATTMVSLLAGEEPGSPQDARAEKVLLDATKKFERPVSFLLLLADYYSVRNRCPEAEAVYREILEKNPNEVLALNNLALLLALERKRLEEAERLVNRAIELRGPAANALDSRASVYLARGKLDAALADVNAVIADSPAAAAYFHRALILAQQNRLPEARQALKTAQQKGLKAELLHPLEMPVYEKLCRTLQ